MYPTTGSCQITSIPPLIKPKPRARFRGFVKVPRRPVPIPVPISEAITGPSYGRQRMRSLQALLA